MQIMPSMIEWKEIENWISLRIRTNKSCTEKFQSALVGIIISQSFAVFYSANELQVENKT